MTNIQHENLSLKQQLETTQHALLEKSGDSRAEQYNSIIASMKGDHEKVGDYPACIAGEVGR